MRRRFQGLHQADQSTGRDIPDGLFLVRVQGSQYFRHLQKPFYLLRFVVVEPKQLEGRAFSGRVYCTPKALWKLTWFLRDFGYDRELLGHDEVDDKNLVGLRGVVKITHAAASGTMLLNLAGFAPATRWGELSEVSAANSIGPEAA